MMSNINETQEQLQKRSETLLMLVYEQINNIDLKGSIPELPSDHPYMKKALTECKRIATKYKDQALLNYFNVNY